MMQLVEASAGFTYADIEYAVKSLAEDQLLSAEAERSVGTLLERFGQMIPYAKTNPEILERLRTWGAERAMNASDNQEV